MKTKYILCDLDETLTKIDVLNFLIKYFGSKTNHIVSDNKDIGRDAVGQHSLKERIRLLSDVTDSEIIKILNENTSLLIKSNYIQFVNFLHKQRIEMIIMSGNLTPVVSFFADLFGAKYFFSTSRSENKNKKGEIDIIVGKELQVVKKFLLEKNIFHSELIVIGNDVSDIPFWDLSAYSIYFGPCRGNNYKTKYHVYGNDFLPLINILDDIEKDGY